MEQIMNCQERSSAARHGDHGPATQKSQQPAAQVPTNSLAPLDRGDALMGFLPCVQLQVSVRNNLKSMLLPPI